MRMPDEVAAILARAARLTTPCGTGEMVWHAWGSGPTVVLLHGGYGSWTHWIRNIDALAAHYRVLAADLPGLGDSAMPPEPDTPWSIAGIVAAGIEALTPAGETYHLVGFSFGAVVGGPLAVRHDGRVRSFTIVSAGGLGPRRPPVELRAWRHLEDPAERAAVHRSNLAALMISDPAKIDELAVRLQAENTGRARIKSRPASRTPVLAEALPQVSAPVSGIYGDRDATALPDIGERETLLRVIKPDLDFRLIPNAGHWVQYEAPEAFNATLLDLLAARA